MSRYIVLSLSLIWCNYNIAGDSLLIENENPFSDSHIHYNWDHAEIISAKEIVSKLESAGIDLAIVSSTPSDLALQLQQAGGKRIVAFFSPYIHEMGKRDWYQNMDVVKRAKYGLSQKHYFGIGEIHFMAGFPPSPENDIFIGLIALAKQFAVPVLIHVDTANEHYFLKICQRHAQVRFILAHAGGNLYPRHIESILLKCGNVVVDFSARDPWRYGGITNDRGLLLTKWKQLILRYPEHFITGTDPVWQVTRTQTWDQPDEGWDHYEKLLEFHKKWLSDLPKSVQVKITYENVRKLLGK